MVPFFSQKSIGASVDDYEHYANITTRKMDQFTGSLNNENYRPKTERRPLFNPTVGLTNIYGNPIRTPDYDGRYVPSKERRNEKFISFIIRSIKNKYNNYYIKFW